MKTHVALMGLAASTLMATAAFAQQDPSYFQGLHVGLGVEDRIVTAKSGFGGLTGTVSKESNAGVANLSASYDQLLAPHWLVGGEVAEGLGGQKFTATANNGTLTTKAQSDTVVSARAGYLFTPKTLVFGRVGYQWQDASRDAVVTSVSDTYWNKEARGALVGVGLEQALDAHIGIRGEFQSATLDHGLRDETFRASANYKF